MRFTEIYTTRLGAGITLPSACASLAFTSQPPTLRAVTNYGQGLAFRFVLTPQVWGVTGDGISLSFDGRTADFSNVTAEVAHATTIGTDPVRFTITQPVAGGIGLDYARLASVSVPAGGAIRDYQCAIGITTQAADLAASPSGSFPRTVVSGTAYVREGATSRAYALRTSTATVSVDTAGRRVTITFQLTGTPVSGGGATIDLGSFSASAPIDAATDNFVATLNSTRTATGSISGRFFGPQALEVGASFGATVADAGATPGYTVIGTIHGVR